MVASVFSVGPPFAPSGPFEPGGEPFFPPRPGSPAGQLDVAERNAVCTFFREPQRGCGELLPGMWIRVQMWRAVDHRGPGTNNQLVDVDLVDAVGHRPEPRVCGSQLDTRNGDRSSIQQNIHLDSRMDAGLAGVNPLVIGGGVDHLVDPREHGGHALRRRRRGSRASLDETARARRAGLLGRSV